MSYAYIKVLPVSGALGAEILGADLSQPLADEVFEEVKNAFLEHLVIFFKDQNITPDQQKDFGRRFGTLNVHPFIKPLDGHEEIIPIVKEKDEKVNFGGGWHSDVSFMEEPALGTLLFGLDVPTFGGDTLFANQYMAYERLSDGMKNMLDGLIAIHSAGSQYGPQGESARNKEDRTSMKVQVTDDSMSVTEHPVVRTHPETGRKSLYVNRAFTEKFKGMTRRESRPILNYLFDHCTREDFTCRFKWTPNSVAFWDNRCTQHYALNDYQGQRREMHRVTINGDKPF